MINKLPIVTWDELVQHFEEKVASGTSSKVHMCVCMFVCILCVCVRACVRVCV